MIKAIYRQLLDIATLLSHKLQGGYSEPQISVIIIDTWITFERCVRFHHVKISKAKKHLNEKKKIEKLHADI